VTDQSQANAQANAQPNAQMEAMMAFWRDAWTRTAAGASSQTPGVGADPMAGAAAWMPSPEAVKRMQGAFLDAMAGSAEQYMRSPQFLDSMRQSLESAIGMRTQMEEYLRKNMGDALRTPGDASAQVMRLLTEMESRIHARFDEIEARLNAIAPAPTKSATASSSRKQAPTVARPASKKSTATRTAKTGKKAR